MAANPSDIIGKNTTVRGEISGSDPLLVNGRVEGQIRLDSELLVAPGGAVDATVTASQVRVEGNLRGSVAAIERITLRPGCEVEGELRAPQIVIEADARFNGTLHMDIELPADLLGAAR
ncbi:MAG: hypothetical protein AMXMBFR64_18780 [Myxococcales bacterium]